MLAQTAWRDGTGCRGAALEVPIVNGNGIAKATGTDVGLSEINLNPGRMLDLSCFNPFIYIDGGGGAVSFPADFELYNPCRGRFSEPRSHCRRRRPTPSRRGAMPRSTCRTSWATSSRRRRSRVHKRVRRCPHAPSWSSFPSSTRACSARRLSSWTSRSRWSGERASRSVRTSTTATSIPGPLPRLFGLTDGNSHPISERFGVVQGTDND